MDSRNTDDSFAQAAMERGTERRLIEDECATAGMVADDMPIEDEESRMTGPSLDMEQ